MKPLIRSLLSVTLFATVAAASGNAYAQGFFLDDLGGETAASIDSNPGTAVVATPEDSITVVPAAEPEPQQSTASGQFVATNNYSIRSSKGDRLCTVPKGTPLAPEQINSERDYVQVKVNHPGCPSDGWISVNGLQPVGGSGASMKVEVEGSLALRESPGSGGKFECGLPPDTSVAIVEQKAATDRHRAWVKVNLENPPANCPREGWVHSEYLRANDNLLASLPVDAAAFTDIVADDGGTEAGFGDTCTDCANRNIQALKDVVNGVTSLSNLDSWRKARGMVQIPTRGSNGNIGPCGSFHYNPQSPAPVKGRLVDNYANPTTACVMNAMLQEWKSRYPSTSSGARVQWGDISHPTASKFNGHKSHTEGHCIDFRPMRNDGFKDEALTYQSGAYSRSRTQEFIDLAKSMGANTVLFNDSKIDGAGWSGGHDNHMHICFPDSRKTRGVCENYKYDPNICGGN